SDDVTCKSKPLIIKEYFKDVITHIFVHIRLKTKLIALLYRVDWGQLDTFLEKFNFAAFYSCNYKLWSYVIRCSYKLWSYAMLGRAFLWVLLAVRLAEFLTLFSVVVISYKFFVQFVLQFFGSSFSRIFSIFSVVVLSSFCSSCGSSFSIVVISYKRYGLDSDDMSYSIPCIGDFTSSFT
ncbi:hypothetical protein C0J52_24944, partial [Blattella germanica]